MTTQAKKKWIGDSQCVDESQAILLLETPGSGCYGIYKAPAIYGDRTSADWQVYLETNGDPVMLPHADYPDELQIVLNDAGTTLRELEQALGMPWDDWCS